VAAIDIEISSAAYANAPSVIQAGGQGRPEQHEAEFPALREQERHAQCRRAWDTEEQAQPEQQRRLDRHQHEHVRRQPHSADGQQANVDGHAHRDEEDAQQRALEGRDRRLDLSAMERGGQEHPHQECPESHRETRRVHGQRGHR
jgi:hypothetical protein